MLSEKRARTGLGVSIVSALALLLAACGSDDESSDTTAAAASESSAVATTVGSASESTAAAVDTTSAPDTAPPEDAGELIYAGYGGDSAELIDEHILKPFTADTGIEVTHLAVPGEHVAGVSAQNEAGEIEWDITLSLADSDVTTLRSAGYLATMPEDLLAKAQAIMPTTKTDGVPTRSGAVQLVCNANLFEVCPITTEALFDVETYPGPRIFNAFQPLVMIALGMQAAGIPADEMFPDDEQLSLQNVETAIEQLERIKPEIVTFYTSSTESVQLFNRGEAVAGGMWNGSSISADRSDLLDLKAEWDGAVKYSQWDVVYKGAPNEENAWRLIDWMLDHPEAYAAFLEADPAGTNNPQVFDILKEETKALMPPPELDLAEIDSDWYARWESVRGTIDEWWASYTQG